MFLALDQKSHCTLGCSQYPHPYILPSPLSPSPLSPFPFPLSLFCLTFPFVFVHFFDFCYLFSLRSLKEIKLHQDMISEPPSHPSTKTDPDTQIQPHPPCPLHPPHSPLSSPKLQRPFNKLLLSRSTGLSLAFSPTSLPLGLSPLLSRPLLNNPLSTRTLYRYHSTKFYSTTSTKHPTAPLYLIFFSPLSIILPSSLLRSPKRNNFLSQSTNYENSKM